MGLKLDLISEIVLHIIYNGDTKMMKKKKKREKVVKTLLLCLKAYFTESLSIRVTQL